MALNNEHAMDFNDMELRCDQVTATTSVTIAGNTLSGTEFAALDGITAGTVTASKAVVVDANKDIETFRHVTLSGNLVVGATTISETDIAKIDAITNGTVAASKAVVVDASKNIGRFETITTDAVDLSSGTPVSHPINLEGLTLADNTNAIRGASVNPTRTSGWTSFSGTIGATPAQCYSDYRELHTTGVAEVLGIGTFPFMDSGASCKSMFGLQSICEVDAGSTVLASTGPGVGIFPINAKLLLNGETFTSGGVASALHLSVQANVTDVSAEDVSAIDIEGASGVIKSLLHLTNTANGFTNLLWLPDDGLPASLTNGSTLNDISATANAGWIRVLVGSTVRYLPLYAAKA